MGVEVENQKLKESRAEHRGFPSAESKATPELSAAFPFLGPNRPYGGRKCDSEFGFCACGSYHYPNCICEHSRNVHGGLGNWCAVKKCKCINYEEDRSWCAAESAG